jgi:hypothetical protein
VGNIIWLLLAGIWMSLAYLVAGVLAIVGIVTIPLAVPAFKLAGYALWPFGRMVVPLPDRDVALSAIGNVVWLILCGWWLAISHGHGRAAGDHDHRDPLRRRVPQAGRARPLAVRAHGGADPRRRHVAARRRRRSQRLRRSLASRSPAPECPQSRANALTRQHASGVSTYDVGVHEPRTTG